jgi:hypothetical protein
VGVDGITVAVGVGVWVGISVVGTGTGVAVGIWADVLECCATVAVASDTVTSADSVSEPPEYETVNSNVTVSKGM